MVTPHSRYIRRTLNIFLIVFIFLIVICLFMYIGGGGVLNDLYFALEEMKELESKNLLISPPDNISPITKREIKLVHNSTGLQNYINETHALLSNLEIVLFILLGLFFLTLIGRIYFRKKHTPEAL